MPNRHSTLTSLFVDIADSIRSKTGDSAKIKADDFDTAIEAIQTGVVSETVELSVTQNGTYVPDEGTAYSKVSVNVPQNVESGTLKAVLDATQSCYYLFSGYLGTSVDGLISYYDTSNVTTMTMMFRGCENLTTIPRLDTSNVYGMNDMFDGCSKLTTIPQLDTSKVTTMKDMFAFCKKLTTIPQIDTSNVTNMNEMFYNCNSLTSIPQLNTPSLTGVGSMFYGCSSLTSVPLFDTSKVTSMGSFFNGCSSLTTVPQFNTSKVTSMGNMFSSCSSLTSVPQFDTSKVQYMNSMFSGCKKLTAVPQFDASKVTNMSYMFSSCSSLKSILMTGMSTNFDISPSTQFEESDLVTILNNLATVTQTRTLTMGATNLAKLTDAEKAIATNKGWTLK